MIELNQLPGIRFHLSMNVRNISQSVAFFRTLFGQEPAKVRADYAKFEVDNPPLVLSLEPATQVNSGGALNHVGFRMPDSTTLVAMQERLERAGMPTKRESGVECCYAKQTKFWAHDPDGNLWEVYTFDGDIQHRGAGQTEEAVQKPAATCSMPAPQKVIWEHRMNEPVPETLPHDDQTVGEILLRGTFNLPMSDHDRTNLLQECRRVLQPHGRIFVHVLTGDQPSEDPDLPGPASKVRYVPWESEPSTWLANAGFVSIQMLKFDENPCFVRNGIGMRETQLEAFAPPEIEVVPMVEVLYKGPFRELVLDPQYVTEPEIVIPRGSRVAIPAPLAARLAVGASASSFTFFPTEKAAALHVDACGS
ncbi:MAG: ArsI/CadI family heavy metal resistance metalloenzyme [Zavarzinella sp.]